MCTWTACQTCRCWCATRRPRSTRRTGRRGSRVRSCRGSRLPPERCAMLVSRRRPSALPRAQLPTSIRACAEPPTDCDSSDECPRRPTRRRVPAASDLLRLSLRRASGSAASAGRGCAARACAHLTSPSTIERCGAIYSLVFAIYFFTATTSANYDVAPEAKKPSTPSPTSRRHRRSAPTADPCSTRSR